MRVLLYEKDGVVYNTELEILKGKFTPAQKQDLVIFIEEYKNAIVFAWKQLNIKNPPKFKPVIITNS